MRYNPWIEGRLRDPINRQFIALQAQDERNLSQPAYRAGGLAFFSPDFRGFRPCKMLQQSCGSNPMTQGNCPANTLA
ncbi:hypothetical protein [Novosphingobium sp. 17-62-19]|uniref:hypothetical protein n=1 Tax=Novosphingobium sp. 17-62-19 TaxID=1970406 RepID=UPI0025E2994B|nr:hypothetical protein [Novosphingobium sp. 17-62-19]